ncbi:hypothetical protein C9J21_19910 [Photobacterium phosphoreum]|uniref:hypothetical protein n=1 Tax=Photobacterium phosphoreum TaxID=659 RepID=UPI000D16403A|nr:hypothetical protein [Photobacterium phosphoreum]PSW29154.1 hypothetical protein C9J21_19910 [Photobacterium phosphoreum]
MKTPKGKDQLSSVSKAVIVGTIIAGIGIDGMYITMHNKAVNSYESLTHSVLSNGITISDSETNFNIFGGNATTTYKLELNKLSDKFNKNDYLYVVAKTELNSRSPLNINAETAFYLKGKDIDQVVKAITDSGITFNDKDGKLMHLIQPNGEVLLPVTVNYNHGKTIADLQQINFKDHNDGTQLTIGASQLSFSQNDGINNTDISMPLVKITSVAKQAVMEIKGLNYATSISDSLLDSSNQNSQKSTGFNKSNFKINNITYVSNDRYNKVKLNVDDLVSVSDFNVTGSKGDLAFKTTIGEIKNSDSSISKIENLIFNMNIKNIDIKFMTEIAKVFKQPYTMMNQNEMYQLSNKIAPLIPDIKATQIKDLELSALINGKAASLNITAKPNANFINYALESMNLIQYQLNHNVDITAKLAINKTLANDYFSAAKVNNFIHQSKAIVDGDMIKVNISYMNDRIHFSNIDSHLVTNHEA